jgi:uncharacterized membrane protein
MPSREPARPWMLVLAYVPLFWLVPLYSEKRRDVRWHARNGLLLFAAVAAFAAAAALIAALLPSLSCLYFVVMIAAGSFYVVVSVLAVVKALQGQRLVVPGLSRYADRG